LRLLIFKLPQMDVDERRQPEKLYCVEKVFRSSGKAEWRTYSAHFLLTDDYCDVLRTGDNINDEPLANIVL